MIYAALSLTLATAAVPSVLLSSETEVEWEMYHVFQAREYFWNPALIETVTLDGREVVTVHARMSFDAEERAYSDETTAFEWRFAIDCGAQEIAIIEYASGVYGRYDEWKRYELEARSYKEIGLPPGGSYETELAALVCD